MSAIYLNSTKYGGAENLDIFSTSEQVVGTWIDNKPIYQRTVQANSPTITNNQYSVDVSGWGIGEFINAYGFAMATSDSTSLWQPIPRVSTGNDNSLAISIGNSSTNQVNVLFGEGYSAVTKLAITIRYTKSA